MPTKQEILSSIGQPDKKRKREEVLGNNADDDGDAALGKLPSKRIQREEQGPKDQELIDIKNESILVVNFGVKKDSEVKIAGFDMVSGIVMMKCRTVH